MGKLQIKRGTTVPAQLAAGEPFFDGENLHIGKLTGTGGNQKIGGGGTGNIVTSVNGETGDVVIEAPETSIVVEWAAGDLKPELPEADVIYGDYYEGKNHLVTTKVVDGNTVAIIQVQNWEERVFNPDTGILDYFQCMVSDRSGRIYIATTEDDQGYIYRMDSTGLTDLNFFLFVDDRVEQMYIDANNCLLVILRTGETEFTLRKYNEDGTIDDLFTVSTYNALPMIAIDENDGAIIVGGGFTGKLKKLTSSGNPYPSFAFAFSGTTYVCNLAVASDSKIYIQVATNNPATMGSLLMLSTLGAIEQTFSNYNYDISNIFILLPDNSIIYMPDGVVIRIDSAGNLTYPSTIPTMTMKAVNLGEAIYIAGNFGDNSYIKRLIAADLSEDTSFNCAIDTTIASLVSNNDDLIAQVFSGTFCRLKKISETGAILPETQIKSFFGDLLERVRNLELSI